MGPQASIFCPAGAVSIAVGASIQDAININPAGTSFCLAVGVHQPTASLTPKTGNTFTGQFGAVVDGSRMPATTDTNQGVFRAHNQDIDSVTIRNLVIRNGPMKGIHAFVDHSDFWLIENNEVHGHRFGLNVGDDTVVRRNHIHSNIGNTSGAPSERGGCYGNFRAHRVLYEENEIGPGCGPEQKVVFSTGTVFRGNSVHDNFGDGIWYDADNFNSVIEGNTVRANGRFGLHYEISGNAIVRNNVFENGAATWPAVWIASSHEVQVYDNVLRNNGRGLWLFTSTHGTNRPFRDNVLRNNLVEVMASGQLASGVQCSGLTTTECQTEMARGHVFSQNRYILPTTTGSWFAAYGSFRTFPQWQSLGFDQDSTVEQG